MMGRQLRFWLISGVLWTGLGFLQAQTTRGIQITFQDKTLDEAMALLSTTSGVRVVYSPDMLPSRAFSGQYSGGLQEVLTELLQGTGLEFEVKGDQIVLFRPEHDLSPFVVSGYVKDKETGERLIGAHVYDIHSGNGAITNDYGFFSIQTQGGDARLRTSYLGYKYDTIAVNRKGAGQNQKIDLEQLVVLREVVIESEQTRQVLVPHLSSHHFNDRQLTTKTYLGGEIDVQRFMESLPGVSIGIDGIGGLHVRGGNSDQNLILFDGVPMYYATHAVGVLSVFNPLMIREVSLQKGDFPARYAGRLSSVLDVRTKEGNNKQWSVQGSIGPAAVNGLVEGPIVKDKIGILVAARRFLPGFYLRQLSSKEKAKDGVLGDTDYAFTDVNAKVNVSAGPKDQIYLSYYHGQDQYDDYSRKTTVNGPRVTDETFTRTLHWGNSVGALRWNHQFGKNVFANATLTLSQFELRTLDYSTFRESVISQPEITGFISREFKSKIRDAGVRLDFDHFISNRNRLRYGVTYTDHLLSPKSVVFNDEAKVDEFVVDEGTLDDQLFSNLKTKAIETGVYVEDEFAIGKRLMVSAGLHLSGFDVRDKQYWSLQPRLGLELEINEELHGHVHVGTMTQYLHLLTSSGIGLPTDLWVPSTPQVKPQEAVQFAIGLSWQPTHRWTIQADFYRRSMRNLINYREGASFLVPTGSLPAGIVDAADWEDKITAGTGKAGGVEFSTSYMGPVAGGEITYAYSESNRTYTELNNGKTFPFRFDRRHAVSATGMLHLSDRWMLAMSWNLATGIPVTIAEQRTYNPPSLPIFNPVEVLDYSERNAYRLPAYHRLDIGVKYYWRRPKATHTIQLDLYNVYNRSNVLYVALVQDGGTFKNRQYTTLPFIPSVSYLIRI